MEILVKCFSCAGRLQELLFGADVNLKYEVDDLIEKLSFGLSNLSILSHILHENVEQKTSEIQISHFSSPMPTDVSSNLTPEDSAVEFHQMDGVQLPVDDASSSSTSISQKEPYVDNSVSELLNISPQNYILKQLGASIEVEKYLLQDRIATLHRNQCWTGSGSLSGFDMIISLPEIQVTFVKVCFAYGSSYNY